MIFDKIDNAAQYAAINESITKALESVKQFTPDNYPEGRIDIDGDDLFLLLNTYETQDKDSAVLEAHRKYIDVMYMVEGSETIYVKPTSELKNITQEYDEECEALLAELDSDVTAVRLEKGCFVVLFPQDAHAPACYADGEKSSVKKIIAKVCI